MNLGTHVNNDALRSESLRAVRGHGIAVIDVTVFGGGEIDQPAVIDPRGHPAIARNGFDSCVIPVRDDKLLVVETTASGPCLQ